MSTFLFNYYNALMSAPISILRRHYRKHRKIGVIDPEGTLAAHILLMSVQNELEYRNIKY